MFWHEENDWPVSAGFQPQTLTRSVKNAGGAVLGFRVSTQNSREATLDPGGGGPETAKPNRDENDMRLGFAF